MWMVENGDNIINSRMPLYQLHGITRARRQHTYMWACACVTRVAFLSYPIMQTTNTAAGNTIDSCPRTLRGTRYPLLKFGTFCCHASGIVFVQICTAVGRSTSDCLYLCYLAGRTCQAKHGTAQGLKQSHKKTFFKCAGGNTRKTPSTSDLRSTTQ